MGSDTAAISQSSRDYRPTVALPFPFLVAAVCSRWRDLALNHPDIWTNIRITSSTPAPTILLWFERSKSWSFDVDINTDTYNNDSATDFAQLHDIIRPHLPSCRSLVLKISDYRDFDILTQDFHSQVMPNLQNVHFHLGLGHSWLPDEMNHRCRLPVPFTPTLQTLTLCGVCSRCSPSLVGLTHLNIYRYEPAYSEFRDLFAACPSLSTLVLREFVNTGSEDAQETRSAIDCSSLQTLAISMENSHSDAHCRCPITSLSMPNLEYLEIANAANIRLRLASHFFQESQSQKLPKLQTLRLRSVTLNGEDVDFFRSMTSLAHLELIDCPRYAEILTTTSTDTTTDSTALHTPFPNLSSVTFLETFATPNNSTCLRELALTRLEAGCPKFTIFVLEDTSLANELQSPSSLMDRMVVTFLTSRPSNYLGSETDPAIEGDSDFSGSDDEDYSEPWYEDLNDDYDYEPEYSGGGEYEDGDDDMWDGYI